MVKRKWYAVTAGKEVGVFGTWLEVSPLVTGVSGAMHQSFNSEEEANRIFTQERQKGNVRVVGRDASPRPVPATSSQPRTGRRDREPPLLTRQTVAGPSRSDRGPRLSSTVRATVQNDTTTNEPSLPSPSTGVTQVIPLPSSNVLSPLILGENGLDLDVQSNRVSIRTFPSSPGNSRRVHTSTVQLSSSNNSNHLPTITINLSTPVHYVPVPSPSLRQQDRRSMDQTPARYAHVASPHRRERDREVDDVLTPARPRESDDVVADVVGLPSNEQHVRGSVYLSPVRAAPQEEDDILAPGFAALGLCQSERHVPRDLDPRSPVRRPNSSSRSSRRPSPKAPTGLLFS